MRGQAWTGADKITAVDVSIDFGQTWPKSTLLPARNRFAPHRLKANINFPTTGYYEVWARATDSSGKGQPMVSPGWNTGGYGNNATHRIAVRVAKRRRRQANPTTRVGPRVHLRYGGGGAVAAQDKAAPTIDPIIDPSSSLIVEGDFEIVKGYCSACHSTKLIAPSGKTRDGWVESICWMQKNHGR